MRYGDALPVGFKYVPFWAKKDLEKNPFALVDLRAGDSVMDCGAHVGMFAAAALEQGAGVVTCYEPAPKNLERLRENTRSYGGRAQIISAALAPRKVGKLSLALSGFDGSHQLELLTKRLGKVAKKTVVVESASFPDELRRLRPAVLKIDVEGAEYDLLATLISGDLASVRSLFIEFHPTDGRDAKIAEIERFVIGEGLLILSNRRRAFVANR